MRNVNGDDKWILKLPPNAPVHELIAPPNVEPALAKKLLCLEACKQLHQIGALMNISSQFHKGLRLIIMEVCCLLLSTSII